MTRNRLVSENYPYKSGDDKGAIMSHPKGPIMFNPKDELLVHWSSRLEKFGGGAEESINFPYKINEMLYHESFAEIC